MTIKILGAACVILGSCAWGALGVIKLRRRASGLAAVTRSLGALRAELCTRLTPMPEITRRLAQDSDEPVKSFWRNLAAKMPELGDARFSDLWEQTAASTRELPFLPDEAAVFIEAGRVIGRYDIEEQRAALIFAEERFREFTERAEQRRDKDSKTRAALGVSAGIFITLVLL